MEETLTVPRLKALQAYWADCPPIQAMIAAYLGIKVDEPKQSKQDFFSMIQNRPDIVRRV